MRIISNFRDFYDSGMSQGIDTEKIFRRDTMVSPLQFPLKHRGHYGKDREGVPSFCWTQGMHDDIYVDSFLVLLAGKLYPGVEVSTSLLDTPQQFYTIESLVRHIEKNNLQHLLNGWRGTPSKEYVNDIKDHFALRGSELLRSFAVDNKIAIAMNKPKSFRHIAPNSIIINPDLSKIHFQKTLDAYTAYQELEMWVCGVLTEPDPPSPMTDKDKIVSHGFCPVSSFRKSKQQK